MWQHGYSSGKESMIALIIAACIAKGRASVKLNELSVMAEDIGLELPDYYLGERVLELLDQLKVTA